MINVVVAFLAAFCAAMLQRAAAQLELPRTLCRNEAGVGSTSHGKVLDRLNGKRLMFIGDSVSRYQYLELAYYVAYGRCPDRRAPHYILSELLPTPRSWPQLYKESSEQLRVSNRNFECSELCHCKRLSLVPGMVSEQRSFEYHDVQGRRFWLAYGMYYNEAFGSIKGAMATAKALMPTHIVLNIGVWLHWSAPRCEEPGRPGPCPPMRYICGEFANARKAGSPFQLWWNTPTPNVKLGELSEMVGEGHHLNVREQCNLNDTQVVDRRAALDALEPDREKQKLLWWRTGGAHLHEEGNHAFNHALISRLDSQAPSSGASRESRRLWRVFEHRRVTEE